KENVCIINHRIEINTCRQTGNLKIISRVYVHPAPLFIFTLTITIIIKIISADNQIQPVDFPAVKKIYSSEKDSLLLEFQRIFFINCNKSIIVKTRECIDLSQWSISWISRSDVYHSVQCRRSKEH